MSDNDLISRDTALDAICGCFNILEAQGISIVTARAIVISVLNNAPAVDAVPVRHGRDIWHLQDHPCEFKCSLCEKEINEFWADSDIEYCPFCGAKMDGGEINVE